MNLTFEETKDESTLYVRLRKNNGELAASIAIYEEGLVEILTKNQIILESIGTKKEQLVINQKVVKLKNKSITA